MAVYIKGMKIPKEGYVDVRLFSDGRATTQTGEPPFYREMEITAIKEPHGRLIDADTAYDKIGEQEGGNLVDMDSVGAGLEETPTIIERSEDE